MTMIRKPISATLSTLQFHTKQALARTFTCPNIKTNIVTCKEESTAGFSLPIPAGVHLLPESHKPYGWFHSPGNGRRGYYVAKENNLSTTKGSIPRVNRSTRSYGLPARPKGHSYMISCSIGREVAYEEHQDDHHKKQQLVRFPSQLPKAEIPTRSLPGQMVPLVAMVVILLIGEREKRLLMESLKGINKAAVMGLIEKILSKFYLMKVNAINLLKQLRQLYFQLFRIGVLFVNLTFLLALLL